MSFLPILDELFSSDSVIFLIIGMVIGIMIGLKLNSTKKALTLAAGSFGVYGVCELLSNFVTNFLIAIVALFVGTIAIGCAFGFVIDAIILLIKKGSKRTVYGIIIVAVIACIVFAVYCLTNPKPEREFPINGDNVSDMNTEEIVSKIADVENLEDGSLLCVSADNFDLMFTPDFNWANDGAVRYLYTEREKVYSAQLRMFHDENKYFITESDEWIKQNRTFQLQYYLDALKYIPQEEVRQLSPDADGYSVMQVDYGVPDDFDRVITYSSDGVMDIESWNIHLTVQPLHEVDGAYNGSGDELIHLFYGGIL